MNSTKLPLKYRKHANSRSKLKSYSHDKILKLIFNDFKDYYYKPKMTANIFTSRIMKGPGVIFSCMSAKIKPLIVVTSKKTKRSKKKNEKQTRNNNHRN